MPVYLNKSILARSLKVYEYSKPFSPELSDDFPILCAKYSNLRLEFFICGGIQNLCLTLFLFNFRKNNKNLECMIRKAD